jgi:hypothetical protein
LRMKELFLLTSSQARESEMATMFVVFDLMGLKVQVLQC